MAQTGNGTIRARAGESEVVSIEVCWPQDKIDANSKSYPDGVVDVDNFTGNKSTPTEREWFRGAVRFALGLDKQRPSPMVPWGPK
jgi:hypothetical protein